MNDRGHHAESRAHLESRGLFCTKLRTSRPPKRTILKNRNCHRLHSRKVQPEQVPNYYSSEDNKPTRLGVSLDFVLPPCQKFGFHFTALSRTQRNRAVAVSFIPWSALTLFVVPLIPTGSSLGVVSVLACTTKTHTNKTHHSISVWVFTDRLRTNILWHLQHYYITTSFFSLPVVLLAACLVVLLLAPARQHFNMKTRLEIELGPRDLAARGAELEWLIFRAIDWLNKIMGW